MELEVEVEEEDEDEILKKELHYDEFDLEI